MFVKNQEILSGASRHLIFPWLLVVSETSKVEISIGISLEPPSNKFRSQETFGGVTLEELRF